MPPLLAAIPAIGSALGTAGTIAGGASALGGLAGALGSKKEGGQAAANAYSGLDPKAATNLVNQGAASTGQATTGQAAQDVMSNPLLSQMFGQGGMMGQTGQQISDLYKPQGLTDQDKTEYGQASGNIARQFGQQSGSMANALSQRGLGNSGVAGAQFSGLAGNQNEQLGHLQSQIADNRAKMNQQRLGTMQNFMSNLGQQAQGAMGQDIQSNLARGEQQYGQGMGQLKGIQGQANEGLQQMQQTAKPSESGQVLGGMFSGLGAANQMAGKGGMFGEGGAFGAPAKKV